MRTMPCTNLHYAGKEPSQYRDYIDIKVLKRRAADQTYTEILFQ